MSAVVVECWHRFDIRRIDDLGNAVLAADLEAIQMAGGPVGGVFADLLGQQVLDQMAEQNQIATSEGALAVKRIRLAELTARARNLPQGRGGGEERDPGRGRTLEFRDVAGEVRGAFQVPSGLQQLGYGTRCQLEQISKNTKDTVEVLKDILGGAIPVMWKFT